MRSFYKTTMAKKEKRIYESARWRKLRHLKLRESPLCALCPSEARRPATDVDHILPVQEHPELAWNWDNLQSLCHECHSRKTCADMAGGLMPGCDKSGMPLDARHWWY
jgi:5-methylcytosine-specific restriction endonuclease McrA